MNPCGHTPLEQFGLLFLVSVLIVRVPRKVMTNLLAGLFLILCLGAGMWVFRVYGLDSLISVFRMPRVEPLSLLLEQRPFIIEVPAFGELQTASATPISVPRVRTGGMTVFWIVKNGSRVKTGDTLVEFDATDLILQAEQTQNSLETLVHRLEATVLQGNSDVGQMVAASEIAGMELEKAKTQAPKDAEIFTRNQIIEGEQNIGLSTTRVRELGGKIDSKKKINTISQRILVIERHQQENRLSVLKQSLGSLKILAPHDGLVLHQTEDFGSEKDIRVGDTCWSGQTIMTIPDISTIEARIFVLESDAGALRTGQTGQLVVDSHPNIRLDAVVKSIDSLARRLQSGSPVKYFEARLDIRGGMADVLKPGKSVRALITVAKMDSVITVPRSAVVEEGNRFFVWINGPGGPAKREVEVSLGNVSRIVIRSGVTAGESVLLNPPDTSVPGGDSLASPPIMGGSSVRK